MALFLVKLVLKRSCVEFVDTLSVHIVSLCSEMLKIFDHHKPALVQKAFVHLLTTAAKF